MFVLDCYVVLLFGVFRKLLFGMFFSKVVINLVCIIQFLKEMWRKYLKKGGGEVSEYVSKILQGFIKVLIFIIVGIVYFDVLVIVWY